MNNTQPLSHKVLQQDGTNQLFLKENRKKIENNLVEPIYREPKF